jgi:hypothetical protein
VLASVDPAKGSGVKPEELKWTGFAQAVERIAKENGGKVPKDQLMQHLKSEGAVRFEEVTTEVKGKTITQEEVDRLERRAQRTQSNADWRAYEDAVLRFESQELGTEAQYSKYQLPGGENYREVVLTSDIAAPYTSSHFKEISNYVAHMRVNERADASGKPGLFVEEIQSDRHQQAREQGYKEDKGTDWSKVPVYQYKDLVAGGVFPEVLHIEVKDGIYKLVAPDGGVHLMESSLEKLKKNYDRSRVVEGVSDAPFRKDWSLQMFKRALRDAVASGKEWVGWTTGETQADRYDLSKQIKTLSVEPLKDETGKFAVYANGNLMQHASRDTLSDVVGKEMAQKALSDIDAGKNAAYSGLDLKIGGEGMKGFYDKILHSEVQKYVKQWGSEVKKSEVNTGQGKPTEYADFSEYQKARKEGQKTTIWRVDITPEMRKSVSESGQPRFMPAGDMATGRGVKDHREAMDLFEKGYRLYGALYDGMEDPIRLKKASEIERFDPENLWAVPSKKIAAAISVRNMPASDTDYLSAVKQGDTATAQRMVDEAAEANGYTVGPVYHRTSAKNITEFIPWVNFGTEEQATNVDLTGRGEGDTRTYRAFLNVSNPIRVQDEGMAASNVLQQAREQGVVSGGEMAGFPYNKGDDVERAYVAKVLEKNGFDGIVYENEYEGKGDSYIALKPSQIKLADPITKDNAGNVIPLSQRFKATSEDIRYMPSPDSAMPGAYSFPGGYRALPGKAKGSLRIYGPAGSLIGIAASLDEAQRIIRKKAKQ